MSTEAATADLDELLSARVAADADTTGDVLDVLAALLVDVHEHGSHGEADSA